MSPGNIIRKKLVIIGDGSCGKTSLLHVFTLGKFPNEYQPTVFENYVTDCRVDGIDIQLSLWDTAGQEEYERLRPLSYSKADVILIGFAVDDEESLMNTRIKWIQEVLRYCPGVPIILVGLKKDLEDNRGNPDFAHHGFIKRKDAEIIANEIGAKKLMMCSALTGEGVDDVFEAAVRTSLLVNKVQDNGCCVVT
ncbi:Rho GTPase [Hanseniaspora osmophila]|uniref:GTP-binding protein RHO4 n=1 Tax=Hanseniaspora osmophila TaxID=56408 RepID=A0A1E5RP37_9ASCO|nr:GTP-binding protein RHO2 [Hanseniaspora osmophila]